MAAKKKSKKKKIQPKKATRKKPAPAKKQTKRKKPATQAKKTSPRKRAAAKAKPRKKAVAARPRRSKATEVASYPRENARARSAGQSGSLQGISDVESADSESVDELLEEGNTFEAEAVRGVEAAGDADEEEVHTHEVPEDDVPGEYLDKD